MNVCELEKKLEKKLESWKGSEFFEYFIRRRKTLEDAFVFISKINDMYNKTVAE